ncbi:metal ABC transporter substrate-binding protein [Methanolacinia petrolearia]|uniref:metal ABC transporter substrate-binding protein n=1 Tax=Methanolacinia petrolearia TaxID=54120 RepID=UPI003BACB363
MKSLGFFFSICAIAVLVLCCPAVCALNVVSTTSVLWDPVTQIGGDRVDAIYVADPTICPHLQGDIINNRIQMNRDFIATADLLVGHNSSVDSQYVIPPLNEFMEANDYGTINWVFLSDPNMSWNTPDDAVLLADEVKGWLIAADPGNETYYEGNYAEYIDSINLADLSDEEAGAIGGQDVIVMIWQKKPAEQWLGLNIVDFYAPDFYMNGNYTAAKLVDRIQADPEKYANVKYVIENMQSGELAKGVEEALNDLGIDAERVIFTNFPKSLDGVDTIPDVLEYNKGLVMPGGAIEGSVDAEEEKVTGKTGAATGTSTVAKTASTTSAPTQASPLSPVLVISGLLCGLIFFFKK